MQMNPVEYLTDTRAMYLQRWCRSGAMGNWVCSIQIRYPQCLELCVRCVGVEWSLRIAFPFLVSPVVHENKTRGTHSPEVGWMAGRLADWLVLLFCCFWLNLLFTSRLFFAAEHIWFLFHERCCFCCFSFSGSSISIRSSSSSSSPERPKKQKEKNGIRARPEQAILIYVSSLAWTTVRPGDCSFTFWPQVQALHWDIRA